MQSFVKLFKDTDLPNQPDELFEISERSQDEESVSESDDEVWKGWKP